MGKEDVEDACLLVNRWEVGFRIPSFRLEKGFNANDDDDDDDKDNNNLRLRSVISLKASPRFSKIPFKSFILPSTMEPNR